jgi:hypothetical protein
MLRFLLCGASDHTIGMQSFMTDSYLATVHFRHRRLSNCYLQQISSAGKKHTLIVCPSPNKERGEGVAEFFP